MLARILPKTFRHRIALLIGVLGIAAMLSNAAIVAAFQYRFIRSNISATIDDQFTAISRQLTEAKLYDNIYDMFTMIEVVAQRIPYIDNIFILEQDNSYITDAKVTHNEAFIAAILNHSASNTPVPYQAYPLNAKGRTVGHVVFTIDDRFISRTLFTQIGETVLLQGFLLVIGLAVGLYASRLFTRPLNNLTDRLRNVTLETLPESFDLSKFASSEVHTLGDTLSEMSTTLKQAMSDIHDQEKLLQKSERLAAVGTMAAGIAHEVKNPVMTISLLSGTAMNQCTCVDVSDDLAVIHSEAERLVNVVNDFLDLSRPINISPSPTSTRRIAARIVQYTRARFGDACKMVIFHDADTPFVTDEHRVIQIMSTLVNNAVQAGAGEVSVTFRANASQVRIIIQDDGPGLSTEQAERLFLPFYTTKADGTGLGLPVAERIANALGGDIALDKTHQGGARFLITLKDMADEDTHR